LLFYYFCGLLGRQHSFAPARAAFAPLEESKVVSSYPFMVNSKRVVRAIILLLAVFSAASVSLAFGQDFTLSVPGGLHTPSVNPGGSATATIDLTASGGFDSPVSLSCAVTSGPVTSSPPVCTPSPLSATPPAEPSLTVTTTDTISAGTYELTITGTSGAITETTTVTLNVTDLTEDYTLSVLPTTATPSPVTAGSPATTTVTVTPIGSYSNHTVTLSCLSVTPIVTGAPVCAFQPPSVLVASGIAPTTTLTITTFGTAVTTQVSKPRMFYVLWLALPGLALIGVGATGARRRKFMGLLLLLAVASGLLLVPACNTTTTNGPNNEVTPNNTYTFTLSGVDENGAGPSNSTTTITTSTGTTTTCSTTTTSSCNAATVTLEVN
jgi:hypothetical protein